MRTGASSGTRLLSSTQEVDVGEVLEMKRKIDASVFRFGKVFRAEMQVGPTPESCDPHASLTIDGNFLCWCSVGFHEDDWSEVYLDLSNEHRLLDPSDLGISDTTEDQLDFRFLAEAEEYILVLLNEGLARKLVTTATEPNEEPEAPEKTFLTPIQRGARVVRVWHNHGQSIDQLPELVSIEIFDALQHMGESLGELLDDNPDVERGLCGNLVRAAVSDTLAEWRDGSEVD